MSKSARRVRGAVPRIVLDTNVIISALLFGGVPGEVLAAAQRGFIRVVMSPELRDELLRVLGEKFGWTDQRLEILQNDLHDWVAWVEPQTRVSAFRESDEADNRVLEAAIAGQADIVLSGDRQLQKLKDFRGIRILTAREFLEWLHRSESA